jgi:hypothetical protein
MTETSLNAGPPVLTMHHFRVHISFSNKFPPAFKKELFNWQEQIIELSRHWEAVTERNLIMQPNGFEADCNGWVVVDCAFGMNGWVTVSHLKWMVELL